MSGDPGPAPSPAPVLAAVPAPAAAPYAPPAAAPVLDARGLVHAYGAGASAVPVLRGVDLQVGEGEVVGLVGPNGGGKTTVLRAVSRAIVPDGGSVRLDGRDVAAMSGRERARRIAVMAQETDDGMPLSVADAVLLGRIPHRRGFGGTTREDLRIATAALEQVGALHLARQDLAELSGGERQRVLAARALAQRPRLLLLDEPTNHLDVGAQHLLLRLVREQGLRPGQDRAQGQGLATLVVLHDLNLAARYCDRVLVLDGGRVRADGPPGRVLTEELVGEVYGVRAERRASDDGTAQLLFRPAPSIAPAAAPSPPTDPIEELLHAR
ncbi:ABC transporter ATP-binding protein [Brachybacterium sp. DNPG3]